MRPYYELRDGELVLDDSFIRGEAVRQASDPHFGEPPSRSSSHSRLAQLVNELHVRRKQAARRAQEQAKAARGEASQELGLSSGMYLDPSPREWEDAWRVTEAILARFKFEVAQDDADFFVVTVPNSISDTLSACSGLQLDAASA